MRNSRSTMVDMTSLLDVVFILLFALIMNVNISRAEDKEAIEAVQTSLEVSQLENQILQKELDKNAVDVTEQERLINKVTEDNVMLEQQLIEQEAVLNQREEILEALSKQLSELLKGDVLLLEEDIPDEWLKQLDDEGMLIEEWLKYKQIAERYLFVTLRIESENGRVYLDDQYTKINLDVATLLDKAIRDEKEEALSYYIYDWLDHKEGGYSFVFISVVADESITRLATETLFDALQRLQPSFDKDQYLINRFVRYE